MHGLQKLINACFASATYRSQLMPEYIISLILTSFVIRWIFFSSRGVRNDASLVPPIRQTASIFKQPVTIYKTQEGKVKDIKHGNQEKPKQVNICYLFFLSVYTHPVIKVLQRVLSIFSNLHTYYTKVKRLSSLKLFFLIHYIIHQKFTMYIKPLFFGNKCILFPSHMRVISQNVLSL